MSAADAFRRVMAGWAVVRTDGVVVVEIGAAVDEAHIWQIALGWPSPDEITWNKRHGARAFRCCLMEVPMTVTDVAEARAYIAIFRKHTLPGAQWVDTDVRRIFLDHMSDDDALFVAGEFQRMEAEAAARGRGGREVN